MNKWTLALRKVCILNPDLHKAREKQREERKRGREAEREREGKVGVLLL